MKWSREGASTVLNGQRVYNAWRDFVTRMMAAGWEEDQLLFVAVAHRSMPQYVLDRSAGTVGSGVFPGDHGEKPRTWKNVLLLCNDDRSLRAWMSPVLHDMGVRMQTSAVPASPSVVFNDPRKCPSQRSDVDELVSAACERFDAVHDHRDVS